MKNFKKFFATTMATICSVSSFNLVSAWGHRGITSSEIRQLQAEFDTVWKTLKPGPNDDYVCPEDDLMYFAKNGYITLRCPVRAKILKDILVSRDILGTTVGVDGHVFVIAVTEDGSLLALNAYNSKKNDKNLDLEIEGIDSYFNREGIPSFPIARDKICHYKYGGLSLGAWIHMESLKLYESIQKDKLDKLEFEKKNKMYIGLKNRVSENLKNGTIFDQPFIIVLDDDKFSRTLGVLLPSDLSINQYENLKKLDDSLELINDNYICGYDDFSRNKGKSKYRKTMKSLTKILPKSSPVFMFNFKFLNSNNDVLKRPQNKGYETWRYDEKWTYDSVRMKTRLKDFIV